MSGGLGSVAVSPDALTISRAAIVGPFTGPVLHVPQPAFNDPDNLQRWADGPRVTACFTELIEGLVFDANSSAQRATLGFANLQARAIQRKTLLSLRAPTPAQFKKQLYLVAAYADLRPDRAAEIVAQIGFPLPFWSSLIGLHEHRHKKTLQLLDLAFGLAVHVEMRFKHMFAVIRPDELSPQIQAMIPTPGHGSWPSGHATEAFITATVLQALLDDASPSRQRNGEACHEQLQRLAARIATNRVVAGVHYPVDSAVGRVLGTALGEFLVARATGGKTHERGFDARAYEERDGSALDFSLHQSLDQGHGYSRSKSALSVAESPLMAWMWKEAVKEWK